MVRIVIYRLGSVYNYKFIDMILFSNILHSLCAYLIWLIKFVSSKRICTNVRTPAGL